jgi:hypothetical protein
MVTEIPLLIQAGITGSDPALLLVLIQLSAGSDPCVKQKKGAALGTQ